MNRLRGIALFFTLVLSAYGYRLYDWQIQKFDQFQSRSQSNTLRSEPIRAWRGEIRTRDGVLLATNRLSVDLIYKWKSSKDNRPVVSWEKIRYLAGIKDPVLPELPVGSELTLARNIPQQNLPALYEYVVFQPNLELRERIERVYPQGKLASNLLGYVGETTADDVNSGKYQLGDIIGKTGLEASMEDQLRGVNGLKLTEVDFKGRRINERIEQEGEAGKNLTLTIDSTLQRAAEKALEEGMQDIKRQYSARKDIKEAHGAVVAIDPRNGQVLALASRPTFDPNWFATSPAPPERAAALLSDDSPTINRAVYPYTPGSVFKPSTTNAVLEAFGRNPVYNCPSSIFYGGRAWKNWDRRNSGPMDGRKAIAHSCNPWYFQSSIQGDPVPFSNVLGKRTRELGFGEPTGIELIGEKTGLIPSQDTYKKLGIEWYPGFTLNMSIGQGDVLVTPLQLAKVMATLINEGRKQPVTVIKAVGGKEQPPKPTTQVPGKPWVWNTIKEGMVMTAQSGTSKHMLGPDRFPIRTGGKTGTAQTNARINGKTQYFEHSWYEGYGPIQNPNLVVVAFFEFGGEGSGVALPAVKKVMAAHWKIKLDERLQVVESEDLPGD
ncbi:penicillin-binding transpeptidase domain-containing protein [Deinococcus cellulosilyticus]|uniref:Penicillin-binding protein 2 n=1 Tax=Deinococcus cellulosilyticus (strain DSM 18568 / NBRC 106333 / KACC 11606 / 5516J-15) TaxID=1223518 RepID=A0A511MZU6_DEIC1|nr:penicillin-binding transpeptidase domain-containing protein [Deinococcus cellulosilyticus]GEM46140.1 penicillin-binding protein 2 [Deinococcus cellulosilyticus NBRC 106333 = KACC 11606]